MKLIMLYLQLNYTNDTIKVKAKVSFVSNTSLTET